MIQKEVNHENKEIKIQPRNGTKFEKTSLSADVCKDLTCDFTKFLQENFEQNFCLNIIAQKIVFTCTMMPMQNPC